MGIFMILISIITAIYFYYRYKNRRFFVMASKFPGPFALPIIGNILSLYTNNPLEVIEKVKDLRRQYGPLYRVYIGTKFSLMVADPKVTEIILSNPTKNLGKNTIYDFLLPWLGDGLLLSKGSKWHSRRKILTPTFHFKILEQFVEIFDKQSQILVRKLRAHEHGNVFDVYPYINKMALDVICEAAMGTEIHAQTDTQSKYSKAVHNLTKIVAERFTKHWQRNDLLFAIFARNKKRENDDNIKILHDFTQGIIKQRRVKLIQETNQSKDATNTNEDWEVSKEKPIFLDMLLKSTVDGVSLTDNDIQEEVDTFMFEGHDTVTSALAFSLYLLSRHKHVQDKLFEEIRQVFGDSKSKPVSYRDLQDLKYMDLVIKESLRLYPSVPFIGRNVDEDTRIDEHTVIPKNSSLMINFLLMFRDSKNFQNPEHFIPERFESENIDTYSYIPFSAGSRNCIGQRFALLELKCTISKILQHFELLPEGPDPLIVLEVVLRSMNGVHLGLRPRAY